MLITVARAGTNTRPVEKRGSTKKSYLGPLASGLNRRAFLKTSMAVSLLASTLACKPSGSGLTTGPDKTTRLPPPGSNGTIYFGEQQRKVLDAVQMQLFPDDGDGPSARDLNGIAYLEWAMSDPQNIEDGDPEFIAKGIGWLNDLSAQTQGDIFLKLAGEQQDKVLKQIASSRAGENWLSILIYYLTEALMLDPIYGGNPEMTGWHWLQHQPGFPRPVAGKTYRDFE